MNKITQAAENLTNTAIETVHKTLANSNIEKKVLDTIENKNEEAAVFINKQSTESCQNLERKGEEITQALDNTFKERMKALPTEKQKKASVFQKYLLTDVLRRHSFATNTFDPYQYTGLMTKIIAGTSLTAAGFSAIKGGGSTYHKYLPHIFVGMGIGFMASNYCDNKRTLTE